MDYVAYIPSSQEVNSLFPRARSNGFQPDRESARTGLHEERDLFSVLFSDQKQFHLDVGKVFFEELAAGLHESEPGIQLAHVGLGVEADA